MRLPNGSLRQLVAHYALTLGGRASRQRAQDLKLGWMSAGGYFIVSSLLTGFSNGFWKKVGASVLAGIAGAIVGRKRDWGGDELYNTAKVKPTNSGTGGSRGMPGGFTEITDPDRIRRLLGLTPVIFSPDKTSDLRANLNSMTKQQLEPNEVIRLEGTTSWRFRPHNNSDDQNASVSYFYSDGDTYLVTARKPGVAAPTKINVFAESDAESYSFPLTLT